MEDANEYRTVQIFLSDDGVHDVQVSTEDSEKIRCTCPRFILSKRCAHVKFVKTEMDKNEGHYVIPIDEEDAPSEEEVMEAIKDPKTFRDFLIRYAEIEVVD